MVFRVFSWIIWFVFFVFLVLLTFFSGSDSDIKNFSVDKTSTWFFTVSGSGALSSLDDIANFEEAFGFEKVSAFDSIYFRWWSNYSVDSVDDMTTINLWKWEFIIDIKNLRETYMVTHQFFDIKLPSSGKIYVNTQDTKNYSIIPFNTIAQIDLKEWDTFITSLYLYPHMYLRFNPLRSRFLKNADLVRLSSVFTLDSFDESLSKNNWKDLLTKLWIENADFLSSYLTLTKEIFIENEKKLDEIYAMDSWEFPWTSYLKRYFYLFLNDTKKKAYHKNSIFQKLNRLVSSDKKETELIASITDDMKGLSLYQEDFDEIKDIIEYYYTLSLSHPDFSRIYGKVNLYSLWLSIDWIDSEDDIKSYLALHSLYDTYDLSSEYSYENLMSFVQDYIQINKVFDGELTLSKKEELDYFSLFLNKIFISKLSSDSESLEEFSTENNLNHILWVMKDYISIDNIVYDSLDDKRTITGVYVHLAVLEKLEDFIRNGLFKKERLSNGVLEKNANFLINAREISLLQTNIESLLDFYSQNKKFLSEENQKDISLIKDYEWLGWKFVEYFSALSDYDTYIYNYDDSKSSLFGIETLWEKNNNIIISKENALKYLDQFSNISVGDLKIDVKEDYYEISDFIANGKNFSFSLYPFDNHKIDSIVINNKPVSFSYKLDIVKLDWDDRKQGARDQQEREKYDFSNFFSNTFSDASSWDTAEIFEINNDGSANQDKFIVVFKRDKLLWKTWEFSVVDDFLDIDFSDIDVVAAGELYDIFITDANMRIDLDKWDITANFTSNYVLQEDKHYFKNIRLYPYKSNLWVKKPVLWDNFIQVVWNIDLVDLKSEMQAIWKVYPRITSLYNSIQNKLDVSEMSVRYIKSSKKVNFRFDYAWDFISILLSGDTIENISKSWEILIRNTNYRTIDDIVGTGVLVLFSSGEQSWYGGQDVQELTPEELQSIIDQASITVDGQQVDLTASGSAQ